MVKDNFSSNTMLYKICQSIIWQHISNHTTFNKCKTNLNKNGSKWSIQIRRPHLMDSNSISFSKVCHQTKCSFKCKISIMAIHKWWCREQFHRCNSLIRIHNNRQLIVKDSLYSSKPNKIFLMPNHKYSKQTKKWSQLTLVK